MTIIKSRTNILFSLSLVDWYPSDGTSSSSVDIFKAMSSQQPSSSASNSPTNILGSPFSAISPSINSPVVSPSLGFGPVSNNQVLHSVNFIAKISLVYLPRTSAYLWSISQVWSHSNTLFRCVCLAFPRFLLQRPYQGCTQLAAQKISSLLLAWGLCQLTALDKWCLRNGFVSSVETARLVSEHAQSRPCCRKTSVKGHSDRPVNALCLICRLSAGNKSQLMTWMSMISL